MNIIYLFLGWLFGLISPQIVDRIKRYYQRSDLKCGLESELKEIKVRLASTVYLLSKKVGIYDKQLIEWTRKQLEGYEGRYPVKRLLSNLEKLSNKANNQQLAAMQLISSNEDSGLSLKKFYLPFLESKIDSLPVFSGEFRNLIFEIRSQIQILNGEIDNAQWYFRKTFDSSMSSRNHEIVRQNTKTCYKNIASQIKPIVEKINDLILIKS